MSKNAKIGLITISVFIVIFLITFTIRNFKKQEIVQPQEQLTKKETTKNIENPLFKLREEGWTRDIEPYFNYVKSKLLAKDLLIAKYKIKMGDNLWKIAKLKRLKS